MPFCDEMTSAFNAVNIINIRVGASTPTPTSTSRTLTFDNTTGEYNVYFLRGGLASPHMKVCLFRPKMIKYIVLR